jgi:hypothetical protein
MERYIHKANIEHYRRLIAESEGDPNRNEDRYKMLLLIRLIAFLIVLS